MIAVPMYGRIPVPPPLRIVEDPNLEPRIVVHVERPRHREVLRAVLEAVIAAHEVSEEDIRGRSHHRRDVAARHEVWRQLRARAWSLSEIGREFARDHSTVMCAVRKAPR